MFINYNILFFLAVFKMFNTHEVCKTEDVHALILARGGSKGIHLKNLIELNGLSLLARTITTIQKSGLFVIIWVSTDNIQIENEARKYGASVHRRPALFSQDQTSSLDSVQEFLNVHPTIERFALFQCTSVFLNTYYILEAVKKYRDVDCVFSVKRCDVVEINPVDSLEIDTMEDVQLAQCILSYKLTQF